MTLFFLLLEKEVLRTLGLEVVGEECWSMERVLRDPISTRVRDTVEEVQGFSAGNIMINLMAGKELFSWS